MARRLGQPGRGAGLPSHARPPAANGRGSRSMESEASMSGPYHLANLWTQWQKSVLDESAATVGRLARLPTLWERSRRVRKGVSPSEVVYEEDRLKVLHYLDDRPPRYRTPLV